MKQIVKFGTDGWRGIIADDFLHILGDEARFAGQIAGSEWSKWLAERTMALSGLEPMTQARKHVFALDFQAAIADAAGDSWDTLNPYLKRSLEGYGLDRTAWDVIRSTAPHAPDGSAGFIAEPLMRRRELRLSCRNAVAAGTRTAPVATRRRRVRGG